jgi:hypothetical protein
MRAENKIRSDPWECANRRGNLPHGLGTTVIAGRETGWRRIVGYLLSPALSFLIIGSSLLHSHDALARSAVKFDPAQCRSNAQGKFYVALGPTVLALSAPVIPISVDNAGVVRRAPPDPKQPVGCPDNPMQVGGYVPLIASTYPGEKEASPAQREGVSDFALIDITPTDSALGRTSEEWSFEASYRKSVESACSYAARREELPAGLIACRSEEAPTEVDDWMAAYLADPDVYRTPLGHKFTFDCQGDLYKDGLGDCHVIYAISPSLGLSYSFQPDRGPVILPIADVIAYDRTLRRQVLNSIVENYPWPSETARRLPVASRTD